MEVTVLSDASFCPKYKVAGYGYWIACGRGKEGGGGEVQTEVQDTNSAEMMAVCNAVFHGIKSKLIESGDKILIQTDSVAAIERFKGSTKVTITEQQMVILKYYEKVVTRMNLKVRFKHVKAHTDDPSARSVANRMCDKRARIHMKLARREKMALPYIKEIEELLK